MLVAEATGGFADERTAVQEKLTLDIICTAALRI
jgi:hypothetical protein